MLRGLCASVQREPGADPDADQAIPKRPNTLAQSQYDRYKTARMPRDSLAKDNTEDW